MKIYSHSKISQKTIDYKKKYVNNIISKVRRGSASMEELNNACEMIHWLWKWEVIDREESGKLADLISDAMEGKYPEDNWDDEGQFFKEEK